MGLISPRIFLLRDSNFPRGSLPRRSNSPRDYLSGVTNSPRGSLPRASYSPRGLWRRCSNSHRGFRRRSSISSRGPQPVGSNFPRGSYPWRSNSLWCPRPQRYSNSPRGPPRQTRLNLSPRPRLIAFRRSSLRVLYRYHSPYYLHHIFPRTLVDIWCLHSKRWHRR